MKKRILCICLAAILLLSGCTISFEIGTRPPIEVEPLMFMVPRYLIEEEPSPELQRSIDQIKRLVEANPYIGTANDFWINHIGTNHQTLTITWLAVNRTGRGIQNISFDLSFLQAGEISTIPVELTEELIGIIPDQTATVFTLNFPTEQAFEYILTLISDAMDGTGSMTLENTTVNFIDIS